MEKEAAIKELASSETQLASLRTQIDNLTSEVEEQRAKYRVRQVRIKERLRPKAITRASTLIVNAFDGLEASILSHIATLFPQVYAKNTVVAWCGWTLNK
ncbi:hypothetical protein ACFX14_032720 [Malus domestica]